MKSTSLINLSRKGIDLYVMDKTVLFCKSFLVLFIYFLYLLNIILQQTMFRYLSKQYIDVEGIFLFTSHKIIKRDIIKWFLQQYSVFYVQFKY